MLFGSPMILCFNTQPPEGGCEYINKLAANRKVSTLSRPKAAVFARLARLRSGNVSTLSRPKAAAVQAG